MALFDGTSLAGWNGDTTIWRVEGGAIVASGTTAENTFLIYEPRTFADFTLRVELAVPPDGNSGVQYRSTVVDAARWIVAGYQSDASAGNWGNIYEERLGRKVMVEASAACERAVRTDSNIIEITATGSCIEHRLNAELCGVFGETETQRPTSGVIALQYHRPGNFRLEVRAVTISSL